MGTGDFGGNTNNTQNTITFNASAPAGMSFKGNNAIGLKLTTSTLQMESTRIFGWTAATSYQDPLDTGLSRSAVGVVAVGNGSAASKSAFIQSGMTVFVTANFTTSGVGTALENITGLTWTFPATALNWPFHCHIAYSQAVGTAAVAFGIKASTNNPTNIFATGELFTAAGTVTTGVLATLATQTATNIVTGTPGGTGTNLPVDLYGTLELPASAVAINFMTSTATAADTVTVLRGSYCSLTP